MRSNDSWFGLARVIVPSDLSAAFRRHAREISEAEYRKTVDEISAWSQQVREGHYALLLRNFDRLVRALNRWKKAVPRNALEVARASAQVNDVVVNWCLSFNIFIEVAEARLKRDLGKESAVVAAFTDARQAEYTNHFAYRFAWQLRHYCAHSGLPPITFHASHSNIGGESTFRVVFDRDKALASTFDWKHVRKDLLAQQAEFEFDSIFADAMVSAERLADTAFGASAPSLSAGVALMHTLMSSVPDEPGDLCLLHESPPFFMEHRVNPTAFTVTPLPVDLVELHDRRVASAIRRTSTPDEPRIRKG